MAKLICIETSTSVCSVSLAIDSEIVSFEESTIDRSHSSMLTIFVETVLKKASVSFKDVEGVVVSEGPGSYTGLRIGMSAAKGLCFAKSLPLITVNSLKMMAAGFVQTEFVEGNQLVIPMIDARRMEVFTAVYDGLLNEKFAPAPMVVDETSFQDWRKSFTLNLIGNGALKCKEILGSEGIHYWPDFIPSAIYMAKEGEEKWRLKKFADLAYCSPNYHKEYYMKPKGVKS